MQHICPAMFILHSNSASGQYALEELHLRLGIILGGGDIHFYDGEPASGDNTPSSAIKIVFADNQSTQGNISPPSADRRTLIADRRILKNIVEVLSRTEELGAGKDMHGRFPLRSSSAYSSGVSRTAFLDREIAAFRMALERFLEANGIRYERRKVSDRPVICLTHDVDSVKGRSLIRYAYWLVKAIAKMDAPAFRSAVGRIRQFEKLPGDPHFSFDEYVRLEREAGFRSTFFLLSLPFFLGPERRRYALNNTNLCVALQRVKEAGWELALHPSRSTHLSAAKLKRELNRFIGVTGDSSKLGSRNHYLKAVFPDTWKIEEQLGLYYDATLGWAEEPGFRAGSARPYRPFDVFSRRQMNLWELPLVAMDVAMSGPADHIVSECEKLACEAFETDGVFTLLWHTDHLSVLDYPNFAEAYPRLLEIFKKKGCIGLPAIGIVDMYKAYSDDMARNRVLA